MSYSINTINSQMDEEKKNETEVDMTNIIINVGSIKTLLKVCF